MLQSEAKQHLEKYWRLSLQCFNESDWALAVFFAITLIEEIGKIIIWGNAALGAELDKKGFYNHREKYRYAVYTTLLVNSRVTRIYGKEEGRFAKWFRENKLLEIRNKALYLEIGDNILLLPEEAIEKDDAFLLVCIAGEIYADIQGHYTGTGPDEWQRILKQVDEFRRLHEGA